MRQLNTERGQHMARVALKEHLARPEAVIFCFVGGMRLPTVQIMNAAAVNFLTVGRDLREPRRVEEPDPWTVAMGE